MTEMFKIEGDGEDKISIQEHKGEVAITTCSGVSTLVAYLSPSNAINLGVFLDKLGREIMEEKQ